MQWRCASPAVTDDVDGDVDGDPKWYDNVYTFLGDGRSGEELLSSW